MQGHGDSAVVVVRQHSHGWMLVGVDDNRIFEKFAEHQRIDGVKTNQHRRNCQQHQRHCHHPWGLVWGVVLIVAMVCRMVIMRVVRVRVLVVTLFAVEHEEVHAERIERRHKHTRQHSEVCKACARQGAFSHRFDDAVFGIEAREKWRTDQGQRTQ